MTFQRRLAWQQIEAVNRASAAHHAARYALELDYDHLPPEVVHQAKRCVLDAIGCAIGAFEAPGRVICEEFVKEIGGIEEATVFCSGLRTNALNASLVNSFLVRFLDFNDLGGGAHNSDALASILAVAEREKLGGKAFITALVISYELGARFRDALSLTSSSNELGGMEKGPSAASAANSSHRSLEERGWTSDIRAGFNQPPAIGKLLGLSEEQIANAIGVCMSHALPLGILDAHREENVMAKNLRFGWAAHDAIMSCQLAKRGFTGPVRVIESDVGIRSTIAENQLDIERLLDFSGWRILDVRFKSMPTNATTAGHVYATIDIVTENDLKPDEIAKVNIRASVREKLHTTTPAKKYPRNAESADHSAFYANAYAIMHRKFDIGSTNPEMFTNPTILELIEKITVEGEQELGKFEGISEISTKDGRRFKKKISTPFGLGNIAHTDEDLNKKFEIITSTYMKDIQLDQLRNTCWSLEKIDDVGKLANLTAFIL